MEIDFRNAIYTFRPDELVQDAAGISHMRRLIQFYTYPAKIIRAALDHPIIMNGGLLACMESNGRALKDVAYLLMINRVFAAHDLNEDVTFSTRYCLHVGGNVPSILDLMVKRAATR